MTRIPFDQLSKQFLEELLSPISIVQRSLEVPGESKFVDVCFTPNAAAEAAPNLGLLSRIASTACLLEPFRNPLEPKCEHACSNYFGFKRMDGARASKKIVPLLKLTYQDYGF